MTQKMLTVEEFRQQTQLSRNLAYELLRRGDVEHVRVGRVIRIPESAVDRWIERNLLGKVLA